MATKDRKAYFRAYQAARYKRQKAARVAQILEATPEAFDQWRTEAFRRCQARARAKNITCSILPEDIQTPTHCPVLGIPLNYWTTTQTYGRDNAPTVDRLDNTQGYVKGNIATMSWRANALKRDATSKELQLLAAWVSEALGGASHHAHENQKIFEVKSRG